MKATFQMRIFTKLVLQDKHDPVKHNILLEGDVTDFPDINKLIKMVYDIETTLNEHLPEVRVHVAVNVEGDMNASNQASSDLQG